MSAPQAGLKDFAAIHKYADKLEHKIYGIADGNDGNEIIQHMSDKKLFDLDDFTPGRLKQGGQVRAGAVFCQGRQVDRLSWLVDPQHERDPMRYLTGSMAAMLI